MYIQENVLYRIELYILQLLDYIQVLLYIGIAHCNYTLYIVKHTVVLLF